MNIELWKSRKKELNLNYETLSKISGVSKRTIEDIFRGFTRTPRIDTVEAIEKALGIKDGNLWTAEDYASGVRDTKKISITADEETWLNCRNEILQFGSKNDYDTIFAMINAFIEKLKKK